MQVGVSKVHDSANYGSFLQAYAMQLALRQLGCDAKFILTLDKQYLDALLRPNLKSYLKSPIKAVK